MKLFSKINTNFTDAIGIALIVSMMFIPMIGRGNIYRLVITISLFIYQLSQKRIKITTEIKNILTLMVISCMITLITSNIFGPYFSFGTWIHEFQRIVFLCLIIPLCYSYKADRDYILYLCIIALCINLGIQFMQWRGIGNINEWIRMHYALPDSKLVHLYLSTYSGANFRSGSIFMNPNVYMVIPATVLCVIIQKNLQHPNPLNYIWCGLTMFSMILTGSRTTFIVAMALVGFSIYKDKSSSKIKWLLPIVCLGLLYYYSTALSNFRVFNVQKGLTGSASTKSNLFFIYLQIANPIYWVTGSLGSGTFSGIDSEWGYIYAWFGILGVIWYLKFIKLVGRNKQLFPFQSFALQCVLCLIAMTASVVLCMPMCAFFCAVALVETV